MQDIICFKPKQKDFKIAKRLGLELIIGGNFSKKEIKELRKEYPNNKICKIFNSTNAKEIQRFKNFADIVAISGKSLKLCSLAINNRAHLLLNPFDENRLYFDIGLARLASERKVTIGINFSEIINSSNYKKSMLIKSLITVCKLVRKYSCKLKIFSFAKDTYELRDLSLMRFFLQYLGFSVPQAKKILKEVI